MAGPNEQVFTISTVGKIDPTAVRVERPIEAAADDLRALVWIGHHTRFTFESVEDVEVFAQVLLDRLTDLQYVEQEIAANHNAMPFVSQVEDPDGGGGFRDVFAEMTPEQRDAGYRRLMAAIAELPP